MQALPAPLLPHEDLLPSFHAVASDEERDIGALEPAWGKAAHFFRTGLRLGHPDQSLRCMSLIEVYRVLEVYRVRSQDGDALALLQAISLCADENLPLPTWLARAYCSRITAFLRPGRLHSLDDVFSSRMFPTSPPKKAAAVRQDWQLAGRLCHDAWRLAQKNETLTSFDSVVTRLLKSADYGVGRTKAKSLITMVEKSQSQFLGREMSLSRFVAKRRKLLPAPAG